MYGFFFVYKRRHNKRTYLPSPQSRIYLSPHPLYAYCQKEHLSTPSISLPLCFPFISRTFSTLLDNTPHTKRNKATGQINNETNHTSFAQLKTLSTFALVMYNSTSRTNSKTKLVSMIPTHSKPRIKANNI